MPIQELRSQPITVAGNSGFMAGPSHRSPSATAGELSARSPVHLTGWCTTASCSAERHLQPSATRWEPAASTFPTALTNSHIHISLFPATYSLLSEENSL